jgi:hypothetical protein
MLVSFQVIYTVAATYHGPDGPSLWGHTTQSWSTSPRCCGSGTYIPYACEVAVIKRKLLPGGKEDLAIYNPSNLKAPLLTINGIYLLPLEIPPPPFTIPNTTTWVFYPMRWLFQDTSSITNGTTADGRPVIVGHNINNWDFDGSRVTSGFYDSIGGSEAENLPAFWFPIVSASLAGTRIRIQVSILP